VFRLEQTELRERLITAFDGDDVACMSLSDFLDRCEQEIHPGWLGAAQTRDRAARSTRQGTVPHDASGPRAD
jgi:hypothetical protein